MIRTICTAGGECSPDVFVQIPGLHMRCCFCLAPGATPTSQRANLRYLNAWILQIEQVMHENLSIEFELWKVLGATAWRWVEHNWDWKAILWCVSDWSTNGRSGCGNGGAWCYVLDCREFNHFVTLQEFWPVQEIIDYRWNSPIIIWDYDSASHYDET